MSDVAVGVALPREISSLGQRMLRYRWFCYGMLLLTYIFVYFDSVAPAVVAPELMKEFGLYGGQLGILASMYFYPYGAMQIPSGILSDYLGSAVFGGHLSSLSRPLGRRCSVLPTVSASSFSVVS